MCIRDRVDAINRHRHRQQQQEALAHVPDARSDITARKQHDGIGRKQNVLSLIHIYMHIFDYSFLDEGLLPAEIVNLTATITAFNAISDLSLIHIFYIPVVLSKSGMTDLVYNDFYVEDGADVRLSLIHI